MNVPQSSETLERPVTFACEDETLLGILHPAQTTNVRRGILLVTGGPQYRVGSHRQFVLLARDLAAAGIPVMRFDYRGMGDSSGALRDFSDVGQDMRAAINTMQHELPGIEEIIVWGLCDAASAASFYARSDERVKGLVLLNPWIRTEAGEARTVLRHYYLKRFMSGDFWRKLLSGRLRLGRSFADLRGLWSTARHREGAAEGAELAALPLPDRMLYGLQHFDGPVLLILSGNDLVAREFVDHAEADPEWQRWLTAPGLTRRAFAEADHTFSRSAWRDQVSAWTREWSISW